MVILAPSTIPPERTWLGSRTIPSRRVSAITAARVAVAADVIWPVQAETNCDTNDYVNVTRNAQGVRRAGDHSETRRSPIHARGNCVRRAMHVTFVRRMKLQSMQVDRMLRAKLLLPSTSVGAGFLVNWIETQDAMCPKSVLPLRRRRPRLRSGGRRSPAHRRPGSCARYGRARRQPHRRRCLPRASVRCCCAAACRA